MSDSFEDRDAFASATDISTDISTDIATDISTADTPAGPNGFELLGLAPELVAAVADLGYVEPTQVQNLVVPKAVRVTGESGRYADLMVSSQTGSGKTAAFLLPVLHTLLQQQAERATQERAERERLAAEALARGESAPKAPKRKDPTNPRHFKAATPGALILCPTRELAQQVAHDAIDLVRHCRGLRIANVVGGMPYPVQIARLQNADLVVATPGRLLDLQRSMQIKLDQVQFLVVDEADRMLDLGFADDLAEVNALTAQRRQTMMFSATFAPRIQQLAMRVMHEGGKHVQKIQVDTPQEKHANIKQVLFWADNADHKRKLLDHWMRDASINQALVFCSTQIECDGLAEELQQVGFAAVALHGALSQGLRNRRLMALRSGQVQFLVATDVAARGIDVPTITHVFNFGLPMKAEDYTHRIGRTGRAGRDGVAVTFAEFRDRRRIGDIEAFTHQRFTPEVVPGLEPRMRAPQPESAGRGGRPGGAGGRGGFGRPSGGPSRGQGRPEGGRPSRDFAGGFGRTDKAPGRSFDRPQEGQRPFEQRERGFQDRGFNNNSNDRGGFADRGANRGFGDREQRSFGDRGDRPFGDRDRGSFAGRPPAGGDRGPARRNEGGNGGGFGRPQARPQGRRPAR